MTLQTLPDEDDGSFELASVFLALLDLHCKVNRSHKMFGKITWLKLRRLKRSTLTFASVPLRIVCIMDSVKCHGITFQFCFFTGKKAGKENDFKPVISSPTNFEHTMLVGINFIETDFPFLFFKFSGISALIPQPENSQ